MFIYLLYRIVKNVEKFKPLEINKYFAIVKLNWGILEPHIRVYVQKCSVRVLGLRTLHI